MKPRDFQVSEMRFELTQPNGHYPLKVACLPIPPPGQMVSLRAKRYNIIEGSNWSEKRDSNPRPRPWQGRALPTELFSHLSAELFRPSSGCFPDCVAKVGTFLELAKFWQRKMHFFLHFFLPATLHSAVSWPSRKVIILL